MANTGGYRSPVKLDIGQVPLTLEPELFQEFTGVYNSIHLLNAYLDQLRLIAEGGGGSGQAPSDSMPFNRFFVSTALQDITAGDIVSPSSVPGQNGIVKGALANDYTTAAPTSNFTGVALISAAIGEDVRVGVGPASLEFPPAVTSQRIWAYGARTVSGVEAGMGGMYVGDPGDISVAGSTLKAMPVATCIVNGYALFGQYVAR